MKHLYLYGTAALAACCFAVGAAETILTANRPGDWSSRDVKSTDEPGVLSLALPAHVRSKVTIEVDPAKTYTLSGEFRVVGLDKSVNCYFGFNPLGADGRTIEHRNIVSVVKSSLAELAAPVAVGDTVIKVKGASYWRADRPHYQIAFGARADGGDLPNYKLSTQLVKNGIKKLDDGTLEIALQSPMKTAYAAGVPVRLHTDGATYIYADYKTLNGEWKKFSGKIGKPGTPGVIRTWYPGVKRAALVFALNDRTSKDATIEFRNIKVEAE